MKNWDTLEADVVCLVGKHRYTAGPPGRKPKYMVLHHNAGVNTSEGLQQFWNTSRVASAHYQVESSGRIGQLVNDWDTAWHANNWAVNVESIGVEVSNSGGAAQGWPISPQAVEEAAHLHAALCKKFGWGAPSWGRTVKPHSQFSQTSCPNHLAPGGLYHARFMERSTYWWKVMTGGRPAPSRPPASKPAPQPAKVVHPMGARSKTWMVSSGYGSRWGGFHYGLDFAAPLGTPIYAVADGLIIEGRERSAGSVSGFGNWVWQDSQKEVGRDFIYGHMRHHEIYVRKGDRVKAGQLIARVGSEGGSTGPHLHFETWTAPGRIGGRAVDPAPWLADNIRNTAPAVRKTGGLTMSEKDEIIKEIRASEARTKQYVADFIKGFVGPIGSDVKDARQQLTGGRDMGEYPGWGQLGERTLVDAVAVLGVALGVTDMRDTLGRVAPEEIVGSHRYKEEA